MEREPITGLREPIIGIIREPIELFRDEWVPVCWYRYGSGEFVEFPNYLMNYKSDIHRLSNDTLVKVHHGKIKDIVTLYLDGYACCINLEDVIQASILDNLYLEGNYD